MYSSHVGLQNYGVAHEVYASTHWSGLGYICEKIEDEDPNHNSLITGALTDYSHPAAFLDSVSALDVFEHERYVFRTTVPYRGSGFQTAVDGLAQDFDACRQNFSGRHTVWHAVIQVCPSRYYNNLYYRVPTASEIRLQAYLALSRGTRGIKGFTYHSNQTGGTWTFEGLVTYGSPRSKRTHNLPYGTIVLYDVLAGLYDDLSQVSNWLNQLECSSAFNSSALPQGYILDVQGEEAGSIEFGLFTLAGSSNDYFMVVNRVCSKDDQGREADPQVINLQTSRSGGNGYQIRDLSNGEVFVSTDGWFRNISIAAGAGRLFELRPVFTGNETWADTVNVSSNITVPSGKTLTIDPGARIFFAASAKLIVNGQLSAAGSSVNHISFTSAASTPARSDWYGIYFPSSGSNDQLSYCDIKYAKYGIECASSSPTIDHCTVRVCERGLYLRTSSTPAVSQSYFCKNFYGAYLNACYGSPGSDEAFYDCYFDSNSNRGAYLVNSKPWMASCNFRDNTSTNDGYGVYCQSSSNFRLSESSLLRNKYDGLRAYAAANPELYYDATMAWGGYNIIADNLQYGVSAILSSNPKLGLSSTKPGNNSIYSNSSYEVYNGTSTAIDAKWNYWGTGNHPVPGDFYGTVNYLKPA